ncbi:hypothetical protein AMK19_05205 [Kitasatospora sp. CB01950]|nr:hypothetical protein AMK19_05205 [Kitasatospora sp. CB01950]
MRPKFRTKDNRTVRFGDHVWAQNGEGPFVITGWLPYGDRSHLQLDLVGGGPSGSMRVHAPEDITLYYLAVRPR